MAMNFEDIEIGKRYTFNGFLYMVLGKRSDGGYKYVDVWGYSEGVSVTFGANWLEFVEYQDILFHNYNKEVEVMIFEDGSISINPPECTKRSANMQGEKHRLFKAQLREIN